MAELQELQRSKVPIIVVDDQGGVDKVVVKETTAITNGLQVLDAQGSYARRGSLFSSFATPDNSICEDVRDDDDNVKDNRDNEIKTVQSRRSRRIEAAESSSNPSTSEPDDAVAASRRRRRRSTSSSRKQYRPIPEHMHLNRIVDSQSPQSTKKKVPIMQQQQQQQQLPKATSSSSSSPPVINKQRTLTAAEIATFPSLVDSEELDDSCSESLLVTESVREVTLGLKKLEEDASSCKYGDPPSELSLDLLRTVSDGELALQLVERVLSVDTRNSYDDDDDDELSDNNDNYFRTEINHNVCDDDEVRDEKEETIHAADKEQSDQDHFLHRKGDIDPPSGDEEGEEISYQKDEESYLEDLLEESLRSNDLDELELTGEPNVLNNDHDEGPINTSSEINNTSTLANPDPEKPDPEEMVQESHSPQEAPETCEPEPLLNTVIENNNGLNELEEKLRLFLHRNLSSSTSQIAAADEAQVAAADEAANKGIAVADEATNKLDATMGAEPSSEPQEMRHSGSDLNAAVFDSRSASSDEDGDEKSSHSVKEGDLVEKDPQSEVRAEEIRSLIQDELSKKSKDVISQTLRKLAKLCYFDENAEENRRLIGHFDGPAIVLFVMRQNLKSAKVQSQGCRFMMNWVKMHSYCGEKETIYQLRGIPFIIRVMQNLPNDACIQQRALGTLKNFACPFKEEYCQQIVASDGIRAVVSAMQTHSEDIPILQRATIVLSVLCQLEGTECRPAVLQAGGFREIASIIEKHGARDKILKKYGKEVMAWLIK